MQIAILGPLAVRADGVSKTPSAPKLRTVLAMLALNANRAVHFEQFVEELWENNPPASAATTLQTYVYQLRKSLRLAGSAEEGATVLLTRPHGYELQVPRADVVDAVRYSALLDQARDRHDAGDLEACAELARQALALWRGAALSDLPLGPTLSARATQLEESRKAALDLRFEAELALGRHRRVVDELAGVVKANPTHEAYSAKLMVALYRCGRRVEALDVYHRVRSDFIAQLGIEPSATLRSVHQQILVDDPALTLPVPRGGSVSEATTGLDNGQTHQNGQIERAADAVVRSIDDNGTVTESSVVEVVSVVRPDAEGDLVPLRPALPEACGPNHLPSDVPDFVGREEEIRELVRRCSAARTKLTGGSAVVEITGGPGAGKTSLLVHVAHRVRATFPDGQIFASLTPVHRGEETMADVLAGCLRACGVPLSPSPSMSELVNVYRDYTATRRLLVVVDDAARSSEVDLLRPSGPGSLLLVASRRRLYLRGVVAPVHLPPLTVNESLELLGQFIGRRRMLEDLDCASALVRMCGRLPLAVAAVGGYLAYRPTWSLRRMHDRLSRDPGAVLRLPCGEGTVDASVRASYQTLCGPAQEAFRRLASIDEFTVPDAVKILGRPGELVREVLEDLESAGLAEEIGERGGSGPHRYRAAESNVDILRPSVSDAVYRVPRLPSFAGRLLAREAEPAAREAAVATG
ncbi:BTAD domain-containing putative transcriptional regulator [Amycolatopsis sp. VS8301801F10]|uniref:AfsR/SARP family transcriptional regulator n=1 Tax=Amycolatopsis sp. VS8301801F10 TaxID=2652442 RepID=UPI0038FCA0A6